MIRTRTLAPALFALSLMAGSAVAQDTMPPAASSTGGMMQSMRMQRMAGMNVKGRHLMPATVTAADAATGMVDVTAGGMALKVHFPPAAMKDLKPGDKITLHLGFTQP
jgi:plastocyanin